MDILMIVSVKESTVRVIVEKYKKTARNNYEVVNVVKSTVDIVQKRKKKVQ